MAIGTITFSDEADDSVKIKVEFDPPLKRGETMTPAQDTCVSFVEGLQGYGIAEAMGVEKPAQGAPMLTPEQIAELERLVEAATPIEQAELIRYPHGGGRYAITQSDDRTLIADYYHNGDRELFTFLRNHAPALLSAAREAPRLREAIKTARSLLQLVDVNNDCFWEARDLLDAALTTTESEAEDGA